MTATARETFEIRRLRDVLRRASSRLASLPVATRESAPTVYMDLTIQCAKLRLKIAALEGK